MIGGGDFDVFNGSVPTGVLAGEETEAGERVFAAEVDDKFVGVLFYFG